MEMLFVIAALPLAIELVILLTFYIRFNARGVMPLGRSFKVLADAAEAVENTTKENLLILEERLDEAAPPSLKRCWEAMKNEVNLHYLGAFIPEAKAFFPREELLEMDGNRRGIVTLWRCFWVISLLTFALIYTYAAFIDPMVMMYATVLGIGAFLCGALFWLLFTLADGTAYGQAVKEYNRFVRAFDRALPVAGREAAFIFETSRKDRETLEAVADHISDRFDRFAGEEIVPVLKDAIETIAQKQDEGMRILADDFSAHLTDTLDSRINGLAGIIKGLQEELYKVQVGLRDSTDGLEKLLNYQRFVLMESAKNLLDAREVREAATAKTEEVLQSFIGSNEILNEHLGTLTEAVDRITEQNKVFAAEASALILASEEVRKQVSEELQESQTRLEVSVNESVENFGQMTQEMGLVMQQSGKDILQGVRDVAGEKLEVIEDMMERSREGQSRMAAELNESQTKLEAAVNESTRLFDGITQRMKEAMSAAGTEISAGIKEATGDNAEAIERLAEQAQLLREDYDNYFNRIDQYSKTTYEELDYHVHNITARITEEVEKLLRTSASENQTVLEEYRSATTNLLTAFTEQTHSISLYAKEINLDVSELSENLRNSVAEFNQGLQDSVHSTMGEFDSGLAELSLRIANTVESICDAVEALPAVLRK